MQVIQRQAKAARDILGIQDYDPERDKNLRFLTYCVAVSCDEGILIHNVMTKELLLLESDEAYIIDDSGERIALIDTEDLKDSELLKLGPRFSDITETLYRYLFEHWYFVPKDNDDKELCLNLRAIAQHMEKLNSPKGFIHYTILTTTDCNARCYYCYETGTRRQDMTSGTAHKVVDFICRNYEQVKEYYDSRERNVSNKSSKDKENDDIKETGYKKPITIQWFGGEPLFNMEAIDIITGGLTERGVPFRSSMISNGYLFDDEVVNKAVDNWNLKNVQITLDGTEEVYNYSKAYIYKEGSPYVRVLDNIERILKVGIGVTVRLNLSDKNYEDLFELIDILVERFGQYKRFRIYVAYIFKAQKDNYNEPFHGDISVLCNQIFMLQTKLRTKGVSTENRLRKTIKINNCMADNDNTVVIQANGSLGRCEHYYDSMSCGNIEDGITDQGIVAYWKETDKDAPCCDDCLIYPDCLRLSGCKSINASACLQAKYMREDMIPSVRRDMFDCYNRIKNSTIMEERKSDL